MRGRRIVAVIAATLLATTTLSGAIHASAAATITLSGRVTDAVTGQPLEGVIVDLAGAQVDHGIFGVGAGSVGGTTTAADGTYSLTNVVPGQYGGYYVCFETLFTNYMDYDQECWKDAPGYSGQSAAGFDGVAPGSTLLNPAAGQSVTGIDGHLHRTPGSASISGTVSGVGAGPLGGVSVYVIGSDGSGGSKILGGGTTLPDGHYRATVPPAFTGVPSYLCFTGGYSPITLSNYASQCWNDVPWPAPGSDTFPPAAGATPIQLGSDQALTGFNAVLGTAPGPARISGRVTAASTGAPLAGVTVVLRGYLDDTTTQYDITQTKTAADGTYTLTRLAPSQRSGDYVCFVTNGSPQSAYLNACWKDVLFPDDPYNDPVPAASTPITLTTDPVSGIDGHLVRGGSITGTITQVGFNAKLRNVTVDVFNSAGAIVAAGVSNTNGVYSVGGLYPGTYRVCFDGRGAKGGYTLHTYGGQCWSHLAWKPGSAVPARATPVSVSAGVMTGAINGALAAA